MEESANPYQAPGAALVVGQGERYPIELISGGRRFLHYLVDVVIVQMLKFVIAIVLVLIVGPKNALVTNTPLAYLFGIVVWMAYYTVMEAHFQKTIGKMMTGTVVITEEGSAPSFGSVLKRSLSRLVPFEAFSCFGKQSRGWHDEWSKTYVVRSRKA